MVNSLYLDLRTPDGACLRFEVIGRHASEVDFAVIVKNDWLQASAPASTYVSGAPTAMFKAMAENWRGWTGEKVWGDLEGRVKLTASSDSTGHVRMKVTLVGRDYESDASAVLMYEAGDLEAMYGKVERLFAADAT